MTIRTYLSLSGALFATTLASAAMADVAPPSDYVENCTVENQVTTTAECLKCTDTHAGDGIGRCSTLLSPYCYAKMCDARGGTTYTQVWCRTKSENVPVVPATVINQLSGYTAPTLDDPGSAGSAGAANCGPYPTPKPTGSDDYGCSLVGHAARSESSGLGLLGLLGLAIVRRRRERQVARAPRR